jgi:hypothetical protein
MNAHAIAAEELEPPTQRAARHLPPLPQDCEHTTVYAELWSADGTIAIRFSFIISHHGDLVTHVEFGPNWWPGLRAIGEDPDDSDVQSWLVTEAKRAFRRTGR